MGLSSGIDWSLRGTKTGILRLKSPERDWKPVGIQGPKPTADDSLIRRGQHSKTHVRLSVGHENKAEETPLSDVTQALFEMIWNLCDGTVLYLGFEAWKGENISTKHSLEARR